MPPKKSKILNDYGVLNFIDKPKIADRVDIDDWNGFGVYRNMVSKTYALDALSNTGPYKAIVLRIETNIIEESSWVSSFFGKFLSKKGLPKFVQVKARIPEIHAALPIPNSLGETSQEHSIIDLYPTFVAQDENTKVPAIGSVIIVDFGNKNDFTDPIYIKPVINTQVSPGAIGEVSGMSKFKNRCVGELLSNCPEGDQIPSKNLPASHLGQSLLPRANKKTKEKQGIDPSIDVNLDKTTVDFEEVENQSVMVSREDKGPISDDFSQPLTLNAPKSQSEVPKNYDGRKGVVISKETGFEENRVRLKDYDTLAKNSELLVEMRGFKGKKILLHKLAAKRFVALNAKWRSDNPGYPDIEVISGWRRQRWDSPAEYESYVLSRYGSIAAGRKAVAFASPHQAGLAFDIGNLGMYPNSSAESRRRQKETKLYKWMTKNCFKFGFTPYLFEPWHYELVLPVESFFTGEEFTSDFNVRVASIGETNKRFKPQGVRQDQKENCFGLLGDVERG